MSLSLPKAELTGVFLESLSFGVYLVIFLQCIQVLHRRQTRLNDYLLGTALSLFVLVTAHLTVDIVRNMNAFTTNMGTPYYPQTYYNIFDTWLNILKSSLYVTITVLSDAFMLYRTFVVWRRNYFVTLVPFLLFLADVAIGILWVYTLSLVSVGDNVYDDALSVRVKVFYAVTLSMNVMCTCFVALKIWKIQRAVAPYVKGNPSDLSRITAIIVESASIYSSMLVVMLATYADNSPAMFIFLNTLPPIMGAVFSSVIVRVGLGVSHGDNPTKSFGTIRGSRYGIRASGRLSTPEPIVPGSPGLFSGGLQVNLSHTVHTHIDGVDGDLEVEVDVGTVDAKSEGVHVVV